MAYIGNELQVAYSSYTNIDDISASFNGTTTSFALLVNGVAPVPFPINSQQCLISVGGVLQQPDDFGASGFRLSGNNIVFSSAPATGEDFFGVILAGADYVNVGANFPDGSAAAPSITFDQDTDTGFYRAASGSVALSSNGTPAVTVDGSQRVGIGTTSPTQLLHLASSSTSSTQIALENTTGSTWNLISTGSAASIGGDKFSIYDATNTAHRLVVDSSGRVGIGTSSPLSLLDVSGAITAGNSPVAGNDIVLTNRTGLGVISNHPSSGAFAYGYGVKAGGTSGTWLSSYGTSAIRRFAHTSAAASGFTWLGETSSTTTAVDSAVTMQELMRLDSSGRLLVGTSSAINYAGVFPGFQLATNTASLRGNVNAYFAADTAAASFVTAKSRSGTVGTHLYPVSGDVLGLFAFAGSYEATNRFEAGAYIAGAAAETWSATGRGTNIIFQTTAVGSTVLTERMRIDSSGHVGIGTTNPLTLLNTYQVNGGGEASVLFQNFSGTAGTSVAIYLSPSSGNLTAGTIRAAAIKGICDSANVSNLAFFTNSSGADPQERARIDSSGRLLVGVTSTAATANTIFQGSSGSSLPAIVRLAFNSTAPADGNGLGQFLFTDSGHTASASFTAIRDGGTWTSGTSQPTRFVFGLAADGSTTITEQLRITNGGVVAYNQATPISKSAAATLTVAELQNAIINYTGAAATLTLPTGTLTEAGFSGVYTNLTFEWSVINTGSGTCTIGAGAGHTITGSATIAVGASGRFASRRTAANTFVSYRLA